MTLVPQAGSQLSQFGLLHFAAPHASGEVAAKHGNAWGGVRFTSTRGDRGATEAAEYDGDVVHGEQPVVLSGPGYVTRGRSFVMRADGTSMQLKGGVTGALQAEAR